MDFNNIEYVLIGQNILSDLDVSYLNKFKPIYESSFYGDEMEPFKNFIERLNNNAISNTFKTYVVIVKNLDEIIGGLVVDYYTNSQALEIIYIATLQSIRNNGIGKQLLENGLKLLINAIPTVKCVYFESENENVSDIAKIRLNFHKRNGGLLIPIKYVQPPLSSNLDFEYNLSLFVLPKFSKIITDNKIPSDDLKCFLFDFYVNLYKNCNDSKKFYHEYVTMINEIDKISENGLIELCLF